MKPLAGHRLHARQRARRRPRRHAATRCARSRSGLRAAAVRDRDARRPGSARSPASTTSALPRRAGATSTAATTAWPGWACRPTASPRSVRSARARATARSASACSSAPAPRASCRPSSPTAAATRPPARCRPTSTTRRRTTPLAGRFVRRARRCSGPALVVSTACSSSAKVFGAAARLIDAGLIDAARGRRRRQPVPDHAVRLQLAGAALARHLPAVGRAAPRPVARRGGGLRAAASATTADAARPGCSACGESSDGHHMSSPHPEGAGAADAMRAALADAGPAAGRGRLPQPARHRHAEQRQRRRPGGARRVRRRRCRAARPRAPTGHTLGAAGALEAAIALLALQHGFVPAGLNARTPRPGAALQLPARNRRRAAARGGQQFVRLRRLQRCLVFGAARMSALGEGRKAKSRRCLRSDGRLERARACKRGLERGRHSANGAGRRPHRRGGSHGLLEAAP